MSDLKIITNFPKKSKEIKRFAAKLVKRDSGGVLFRAMHRSLEEVGFIAAQDYMVTDSPEEGAAGALLSRRSGRLVRSILGSHSFSAGGGATKESIREVKIGKGHLEGIIGTTVPYAAIHEFGGTISVTPKMKGFFWHMWYETGDTKWRAMALTKKQSFTMPKRPYLTPARDKAMPEVHNIFRDEILDAWRRENI